MKCSVKLQLRQADKASRSDNLSGRKDSLEQGFLQSVSGSSLLAFLSLV